MLRFQPENTPKPESIRGEIGLALRIAVSSVHRLCAFSIAGVLAMVTVVLSSHACAESTWTVGISNVTWEKPAKDHVPKLMSPTFSSKENITIVILFKGFHPPPSQESVDALYRALTPPPDLQSVFDFTSPARAGEVLRRGEINPANPAALVCGMGRDLPVSRVLVVRLLAKGSLVTVQCNLREAKTGTAIGAKSEQSVPKENLAERLRSMAHSLLSESQNRDRG